jgi:hypothetical protein
MNTHWKVKRSLVFRTILAVTVVASVSCGDVVRSSRSPVMLVITSLTSDGGNTLDSDVVGAGSSVFNDTATAAFTVVMKDVTVAPTTNNSVTINRYRVEYRRTDGLNTPGVDVPYPFDGAVTQTIAAGANGAVTFELVRHTAKREAPLVHLANNLNKISTITDVTFFGTDQVGNDLSVTGSMLIVFGNFGDE